MNVGRILALVALASLAPAALHAEPAGPKPLAESLGLGARPLYSAGVTLYRNKEYAPALAQFRAAYKIEADPRLLWNMAVCEKNLSHFVRARSLTQEYLGAAERALTDAERREATEFATSLQSFVATVTVQTRPTGAAVFVDGTERGPSPLKLELDMGEHGFRVIHAGYKEFAHSERFEGASTHALDWPLESLDARLHVTSSRVFSVALNGRAVGTTPWNSALAPGMYEIEVSGEGFKARRASVALGASETRTLEMELEPTPKRSSPWPWVAGIGAGVVALAIGGYLLLRPTDERPPPTPSTLPGYKLP